MDEIKAIEFPNKVYATKQELFLDLKANETKLISLKTATVKNSEGCSFELGLKDGGATKNIQGLKAEHIYPVINTTLYMDSHNDVHLNKIWNVSVKEQKGKVFYITDHDLKINSVIAYPKDVTMSVRSIDWTDLGQSMTGKTEALIFEIAKSNLKHDGAIEIVDKKISIEHSVRMQYVKLFLAIDSDDKGDEVYKARFKKYVDQIANKHVAIEKGYFWGVSEAKIFKEGSMVLMGSNDVTPLLQGEEGSESSKDAQEESQESASKVGRRNIRY